MPPGPPGGTTGSRRRGPRRGWLVALVALILVAGGAAGVTLFLTGGKRHPGGRRRQDADGGHVGYVDGPDRDRDRGRVGTRATRPAPPCRRSRGRSRSGRTPATSRSRRTAQFAYIVNPGAGAISVLNTATNLVSGTPSRSRRRPPAVRVVLAGQQDRLRQRLQHPRLGALHRVRRHRQRHRDAAPCRSNNFTPGPSTTSPDGKLLYVPNHNTAMSGANENVVDVIDTATKTLVGNIAVPANPHWVAFDKNGRFYTTDHMSAKVTVVNAKTQQRRRRRSRSARPRTARPSRPTAAAWRSPASTATRSSSSTPRAPR